MYSSKEEKKVVAIVNTYNNSYSSSSRYKEGSAGVLSVDERNSQREFLYANDIISR